MLVTPKLKLNDEKRASANSTLITGYHFLKKKVNDLSHLSEQKCQGSIWYN